LETSGNFQGFEELTLVQDVQLLLLYWLLLFRFSPPGPRLAAL